MGIHVGQLIKGYSLTRRIGAGGFGIVYQAQQEIIDREVAVKVILPELASKPDFIRRFDAEAGIVARLEHPHITPLYDYWREPEGAYLVMRYLRGGSLLDKLQDSGALSPQGTARILDQIASALDLAHRNEVIHRDLKPANILLDEDGNAYLADFGIAKDLANMEGLETGSNRIVGSLDYISPEQARGEEVTTVTDIYALGILVYEMLTGKHPYGDVPPVQRLVKHMNEPIPEISLYDEELNSNINDVLYKATDKIPENRYETVLEFARAYHQAIGLALQTEAAPLQERLSNRETVILRHLVSGLSEREIASQLTLTISAVKWHLQQLFQKLGVRSRAEAIAKAQDMALIATPLDDHATDERSHTSLIALPEPQNPYRGLLAFQSGDAKHFFGREEAVERLIARIREDVEYFRFLAVIGPSGSGKSSLVKAGLIPSLWNGKITSSENWFVADMIPGNSPLENLETALKRVATTLPDNLFETLASSATGLREAAHNILPDDDSELVLLIDQFEELFTLLADESERQHFLDILYDAVKAGDSRIRIFITLRADYYDKPLQYSEFGKLLRTRMETVLPLDAGELERAIEMPARQVGVTFETGLIARIVSEMTMQIGALPLLQYALTELFERREGRILTQKSYEAIGGAVGALAKKTDEIYLNLNPAGQALAKQLFLRLVTLGEGSGDTRRRTTREELRSLTEHQDLIEELIDTFANYRLLSLDHDPDSRKPTVEVAHEAILREWKRLRTWLNSSRNDIRQERLLARSASEWEEAKRDPGYLPGGSRLEDIEKWIETRTISLTPLEQDFVSASIAERDKKVLAEQQRVAREKELEQRSFAILSVLVIVFAIATFIALGLTTFAFGQRNIAEDNFERAERIRLAAQAQIGLDSGANSIVTALLSLRSLQLGYSPEADSSLLNALSTGFATRQLNGHIDAITGLAISSDGTQLLSASRDDTWRIWNIETDDETRVFDGHDADLLAIEFSPDNRSVITAGSDATLRVWNAVSGRETLRIEHESPVRSIAISPDGALIASSDDDNGVFLWDSSSGELIRSFTGHSASVNQVVFSSDGQLLGTGSLDNTAAIWHVNSGERLQEFTGHTQCICSIAFSPDDDFFLTTGYDNIARLWDSESGAEIQRFSGHDEFIYQGLFTPDGDFILTASEDGTLRLWNIETGLEVRRITTQSTGISALEISQDGTFIYTGSTDGNIQSWQFEFIPEPQILPDPQESRRRGIILSDLLPDGRVLLMGNADGTIRYWSVERSLILRETSTGNGAIFNDMVLSPNGNSIMIGGNNGNLAMFDTASGTELQVYLGHRGAIYDVEISSDGLQAITGGEDNTIRVWNVFTGDEILQLGGHTAPIRAVASSADNQFILTGSEDTTMRLWDIEVVRSLHQFRGHEGIIRAVAFSPDGTYALSGSDDRTARLWNTETGELEHTFEGHTDSVLSVAFSPDGTSILTGSADGTARLWDIETAEVLRNLVGHEDAVRSVSFSLDGSQIITSDGLAAFIWRSNLDAMIELVCAQLPRDFTQQERDFFEIVNNNPTCPQISAE